MKNGRNEQTARLNFAVWNTSLYGGTRVVFELANRLSKHGHDVQIIALSGDHAWFPLKVPCVYVKPPSWLKLARFKLKRPVYYLDLDGLLRNLRLNVRGDFIRSLAEAIPDCDINIATWFPTAFSVWFSGRGKPYYLMQDYPQIVIRAKGMYGLKMFEATLHLPFCFMTNSSYTEDLVLKHQPHARVSVVGVGVDTNTFSPVRRKPYDNIKAKKAMVILRNARFKGSDIAIEALNLVSKRVPIYGILIGKRSTLSRLIDRVSIEFPYILHEKVSDENLASLYSSADVFVFTSYVESFGLPPLEAMACGTPVVTTDCLGNRDYAIDKYNALVVPPGDPKAVAKAVIKLLMDYKLAERLRLGGMKTVKAWAWDNVVDRIEKAFEEQLK